MRIPKLSSYIAVVGAAALLLPAAILHSQVDSLRISEIRIDHPGTDTDEYFEIQGAPGTSLDDIWYLVLGDHSNFGNPDPDPPNYRSGTVEFAIDLTGNVIPESGFFVVVATTFTLKPISEILAGGGMVISGFIFENSDNVTHVLVRGYQGTEVTTAADQYGDLAVDLDPNDDGTIVDPLPWAETLDAIGLTETPNALVDVSAGIDELVYGAALGFEDIGPDGTFVPGHVYRGNNNGRWNIGIFGLDGGTDTPGGPNLDSPVEPILESFSPRTILPGGTVTITGQNFTSTSEVLIGGAAVGFNVISDGELLITVPVGSSGGTLSIANDSGTLVTTAELRILAADRSFVFYEDFELSLGDFQVVSLASNRDWRASRFGENGFAEISGFGADAASDDWLITPAIDLSGISDAVLEFVSARRFDGPDTEVLISTNFAGGNPSSATWTPLGGALSPADYIITPSGAVSLADYAGQTVYIAFRYTSLGAESGQGSTFQLHEVMVTAADSFAAGWVDHPQLGQTYLLSSAWAYHPMVNYVYAPLYPWLFHPDFGWVYHADGHPDTGAWLFSPALGYLWSRADLEGLFFYEDGTTDNFFLGPQ